MFSKITSILLVYALCLLNFAFLTIPFIIIMSPLLLIKGHLGSELMIGCVLLFAFCVSSLVLAFWFLDYLFSFSVRSYIKKTKSYTHKKYELYKPYIQHAHKIITQKYNLSFKILIKESETIEAFATGSFSTNIVVISTATLEKLEYKSKTKEEFANAIAGLLGHEASHLLNKDFLPGNLLMLNQKATNFVAKISGFFASCIFTMFSVIPYLGKPLRKVSKLIHGKSSYLLNFSMQNLVLPIYFFVNRFLTRAIEYRSDKDAARAFGFAGITLCLNMIAGNSYNSIFSTHPSTPKRVSSVNGVGEQKFITAGFLILLLNYLSFVIIFLSPFVLYDAIIKAFIASNLHSLLQSISGFMHNITHGIASLLKAL